MLEHGPEVWEILDEVTEFTKPKPKRFERTSALLNLYQARRLHRVRMDHFVERPGPGVPGPGLITEPGWRNE